jgi:hypothetical protein
MSGQRGNEHTEGELTYRAGEYERTEGESMRIQRGGEGAGRGGMSIQRGN